MIGWDFSGLCLGVFAAGLCLGALPRGFASGSYLGALPRGLAPGLCPGGLASGPCLGVAPWGPASGSCPGVLPRGFHMGAGDARSTVCCPSSPCVCVRESVERFPSAACSCSVALATHTLSPLRYTSSRDVQRPRHCSTHSHPSRGCRCFTRVEDPLNRV